MKSQVKATSVGRQHGSALLVGMLLLIIMSILSVFAVNVGVFEQRSSRNELRAAESFRAAESGIAAALEFFKANQSDVASTEGAGWFAAANRRWVNCTTAAPDGEVDGCADEYIDPFLAERTAAGDSVYRYEFGDNTEIQMPAALQMVDETLDHEVMALLCFFHADTQTCRPAGNPTADLIIQLTSIGRADISEGLADGSSQATVSQIYAPFRLIHAEVAAPVVANSFTSTGSFEIVTNPNGGGDGVPVSVWTPQAGFSDNGNAKTCHLQEFFSTGKAGEVVDIVDDDGNTITTICNACSCPNLGGGADTDDMVWQPLSDSGWGGEDIIDQASDFPTDLFRYMFTYPESQWQEMKAKAQANGIVAEDCSGLDATTTGLVWVTGTCDLGKGVTGSAAAPMLLISGCGDFSLASGGVVFGLVYVDPLEDGCGPEANVTLGGNANIYGALVVDGAADSSGGTPSIVYNIDILKKLAEDPSFSAWGPIPGTWRDFVINN